MKKLIFAMLITLLPLSSHALFELRAGYGVNTLDEDSYAGNSLDDLKGFNVDFIFEPPLLTDLGFGLRYEMMDYDFNGLFSGDGEMNRLSAIVNYRFIDFFAYFGVIGTIGISTDLDVRTAGVTTAWDDKMNYSLGAEAGVNLGLISIGAEVGKFFGEFESAGNSDLDLSGLYGKVLVGFGF